MTVTQHGKRPTPSPNGSPRSSTSELAAYLATVMLMAWPLVINEAPFYIADSASYLHGGRFGAQTVLEYASRWWHPGVNGAIPAGSLHAAVAGGIRQAGGARSLIYSMATYLLRAPGNTLIALAILQLAAVSFVVCSFRQLILPRSGLVRGIGVGAAIATLTSVPWYAADAAPDIWAGIVIAGTIALTVFYDRAGLLVRLVLVALVSFGIMAHASHVLLGIALPFAGAVANFQLNRGSKRFDPLKILWFAAPAALATVTMLAASWMAFGEISLTPKRYPIQLARSVADGPGAWYLRDHCATERYAICEVFGPYPPRNVHDFLWGRSGVRFRATPSQMERIRLEEGYIVRRATLEYPADQLQASISNAFNQLVTFGVDGLVFGQRLTDDEHTSIIQVYPDRPFLTKAASVLFYSSFGASLLILFLVRRRLERAEIAALCVAATGLVVNAAVCGVLSGVAARYQGRVAWIVPVFALLIVLRVFTDPGAVVTTRKVMLA